MEGQEGDLGQAGPSLGNGGPAGGPAVVGGPAGLVRFGAAGPAGPMTAAMRHRRDGSMDKAEEARSCFALSFLEISLSHHG